MRSVMGLLLVVLAAGCTSRVYFSHPMRESFELGAAAPAHDGRPPPAPDQLQYFVSDRIVLERAVSSRDQRVAGGRIVVRKGRLVERVIVRRGTPAVSTAWGEDWIDISFEEGTSLRFQHDPLGDDPTDDHAPADLYGIAIPRGVYRLAAVPRRDAAPIVEFDGRRWEVAEGGVSAHLQVKRNGLTRHHRSRRVLRGRRL